MVKIEILIDPTFLPKIGIIIDPIDIQATVDTFLPLTCNSRDRNLAFLQPNSYQNIYHIFNILILGTGWWINFKVSLLLLYQTPNLHILSFFQSGAGGKRRANLYLHGWLGQMQVQNIPTQFILCKKNDVKSDKMKIEQNYFSRLSTKYYSITSLDLRKGKKRLQIYTQRCCEYREKNDKHLTTIP